MTKARAERMRATLSAIASKGEGGATRDAIFRWVMATFEVGGQTVRMLIDDLELVGYLDHDGVRYVVTDRGRTWLEAKDGGPKDGGSLKGRRDKTAA